MTEKAVLSDAGTGPEKEEKITEKNCETCEKAYRKEFRAPFRIMFFGRLCFAVLDQGCES